MKKISTIPLRAATVEAVDTTGKSRYLRLTDVHAGDKARVKMPTVKRSDDGALTTTVDRDAEGTVVSVAPTEPSLVVLVTGTTEGPESSTVGQVSLRLHPRDVALIMNPDDPRMR